MLEITSHGITSFTIALAVAAKLTGNVIEFIYTDTPFEVMRLHKIIDFAVVDCEIEHYVDIFRHIDINPNRSTVVVHNVHHKTSLGKADGALFEQVVNRITDYYNVLRSHLAKEWNSLGLLDVKLDEEEDFM
ncbi:hypothetical protein ACFE04_004264 [Oxalis oulophora]